MLLRFCSYKSKAWLLNHHHSCAPWEPFCCCFSLFALWCLIGQWDARWGSAKAILVELEVPAWNPYELRTNIWCIKCMCYVKRGASTDSLWYWRHHLRTESPLLDCCFCLSTYVSSVHRMSDIIINKKVHLMPGTLNVTSEIVSFVFALQWKHTPVCNCIENPSSARKFTWCPALSMWPLRSKPSCLVTGRYLGGV